MGTAILIVVVGTAIAAAVKEIVEASLGGLSYGKALAVTAGTLVLVVAGFAALDQLNIAENVVNGLFYAALAIVVGSAVVASGGGGITTMNRYWERAAQRAEQEGDKIKQQSNGATDRIKSRGSLGRRVEQRGAAEGAADQRLAEPGTRNGPVPTPGPPVSAPVPASPSACFSTGEIRGRMAPLTDRVFRWRYGGRDAQGDRKGFSWRG